MAGTEEAERAFAFVDGLDAVTSAAGVIDALAAALGPLGYEHFILTGLPVGPQTFSESVVVRKWPVGWFEHYVQSRYIDVDPVIRQCRRSVHPFAWEEAPLDPKREPRALEVMHRAADFGMPRGWSLPIHGMDGYEACFSVAGRDIALTRQIRPALHMMALYAFERIVNLAGRTSSPTSSLSEREREVLSWSAQGKSAADVATILGITERTVSAHMGRAAEKLGASNKTHAVAKALHAKIISL